MKEEKIAQNPVFTPLSQDKEAPAMKFRNSKSNISIFGNKNFDMLPEKTAGEKVVEQNKKRREQKDESWKMNRRNFSSKTILNRMFDNLTTKKNNE